mmetsp:Transcript_9850/g.29781  ORF Transcript_9850/g.29781 Transcript_9850/m.29781 type:complete len:355 (+) Transcript_9850:986-2050(+)
MLGLDNLASVALPVDTLVSCASGNGVCTPVDRAASLHLAPQTPGGSEKESSTDGDESDVTMEGSDTPEMMEAAVSTLLRELLGAYTINEAFRTTARRYVNCLIASTSGYQQKLPTLGQTARRTDAGNITDSEGSIVGGEAPVSLNAWDALVTRCSSCCGQRDALAGSNGFARAPHLATPVHCCQQNSLECSTADLPKNSWSTCTALHASGRVCTVLQATLPFRSQCEHHMLPFYGRCHVAVLTPALSPGAASMDDMHGVVAAFTHRLQVQERITQQVADAVAELHGVPTGDDGLDAGGVMVVVDATHMCMVARGVENHAGATMSVAVRGCFGGACELRRHVLQQARMAMPRTQH